jgi:glutamate formiminotransferase
MRVLECVINISEGTDTARIDALAQSVGGDLLDLHSDAEHNRSVFTLAGVEAPRVLARKAMELLDLSHHEGVHPRVGIIDVVPFVAIDPSTFDDALRARDDFARFAATELGIPCFLYGPERTLPAIRKHAFVDLAPDHGPREPHPRAGAICVGARPVLIAYNLWLKDSTLQVAKDIAARIRSESVRALGLQVGSAVQVSMNLIDPSVTGPDAVWDFVEHHAPIDRAELVGLVPARTLAGIDRSRWTQLDLSSDKTIEARFARRNQTRA